MSLKRHSKKIFLIVSVIFILDQVTKHLSQIYLAPNNQIELLPFLNLVYVENTGTAFGLMRSLGSGFFIVTSSVATLFVAYLMTKDSKNWFTYSLIISGALGNLADRILRGYVIDFIDLHVGSLHWPAFNLADSAISVGIVLFIYQNIKK